MRSLLILAVLAPLALTISLIVGMAVGRWLKARYADPLVACDCEECEPTRQRLK